MENYRIIMAQRRLNRGRLYDKQATKTPSDAVITHVTQVTVEEQAPVTKFEEPATDDIRSLKEIWKQDCDAGISYNTFLQRVQKKKWDLQKALHTPKSR